MTMQTASVPKGDSALRAWRKARKLTLAQAGALADTSHSVWLRWETSARLPRGRSLQRLARVTGLTTDKILGLVPHDIDPDRAVTPNLDSGASLTGEAAASVSPAFSGPAFPDPES